MSKHTSRSAATLLFSVLILTACQSAATPGSGPDARVTAVTTTTVLADLVSSVGGDRVDVASLIPPGGEVHTFDPRPSDVQRVADASIVFGNGLGLDDWIAGFVADVGREDDFVALGEDLAGVTYRDGGDHDHGDEDEGGTEDEHGEDGEDGHHDDHGAVNPHVWLNAAYAMAYIDRIAAALSDVDPDGASTYEANAAAYRDELARLHRELEEAFAALPDDARRVLTFHDAFGYFADAYGLTVVDSIVEAPGQEPSAGDVAALVDLVREENVSAILAEAQFPTDLVDRIADETGARVVAGLHTDSIGEGEAATYFGMMRANADAIVTALGEAR